MDAIAQSHRATPASRALMSRVQAAMALRGAHASRTVVLLPYFHLMVPDREAWAAIAADGFAPRFETTMTWSAAGGFEPEAGGLAMDMASDLLTARTRLEGAGLASRADMLAGRLVEAARQVAGIAAAVAPGQRRAWAAQASAHVRPALDVPVLALESELARLAIAWAADSSFATDMLLAGDAMRNLDLLVIVEGLQPDPLAAALHRVHAQRSVCIALDSAGPPVDVRLHEASDPSDEAERAAACVIRHVEAGRAPVALAAVDRVLTRRVHAMLASRGVSIRDETGWKLSTTRLAAGFMGALRASAWNASSDEVIDWLKNVPDLPPSQVQALERRARRLGIREWRSLSAADAGEGTGPAACLQRVNGWRTAFAAARPVARWPRAARELLVATGQWEPMKRDAAGGKLIAVLRLDEDDEALDALPLASRRWDLADFTAWANEVLESESFAPEPGSEPQVVILPLNQLPGRAFAALVVPGCDEVRLNPSPDLGGLWTRAQREAIGLPSREAQEAQLQTAWRHALQVPVAELLWRRTDDSGEPVLPSPLVQALRLSVPTPLAADPRESRTVRSAPTQRPQPTGELLPITQVSASSYEDLRRCPYRFFAMRQLGLHEADELDNDLDKRDFGNWLHQVLGAFHQAQQADPAPAGAARVQRMDRIAAEVTASQRFHEGEFLPFEAAWPQARDGYLAWLERYEAKEGAAFEASEDAREVPLGKLTLMGRIDRVDRLPDGRAMVIDYKTEAGGKSRERVAQPAEDTQLAFYAALLQDDTLRAAYVNVGERGETNLVEQKHIVQARDLLVHGILDEVERIESGSALPALGEGQVCEFCAARGLCRRDFWSVQ